MTKNGERSYKNVVAQILSAKHAFHLLGVYRDSSFADIGRARSALARNVHPDVNAAPNAHDLMARVNAAHSALTTDSDAYVRSLMLKPCAACKGRGATSRQKGFTDTVETICAVCHGAGVA